MCQSRVHVKRPYVLAILLSMTLVTSNLSADTSTNQHASTACPVTRRPEKAFLVPFPYLLKPPDPVSFWYGSRALWTQVWSPPPWTPWKPQQPTRMYWASEIKSSDEQPSLVVTMKRLDADEPSQVFAGADKISYTPKRFGMIASVTFPSAGCWQVSGEYRGQTLQYVVDIEPASSPRNFWKGPKSQSPPSSDEEWLGPETHPRRPLPLYRSTGRKIMFNAYCRNHSPDVFSVERKPTACDIACGGDLPPCTLAELKRLHERDLDRSEGFVEARKMLLEHGVPFDPDILLEATPRGELWAPYALKPILGQMPEMKQIVRADFLSGLTMADTLYLPGSIKYGGAGPTIVIVNNVVYETCPSFQTITGGNIWGTNGIYFYILGGSRIPGMSLDNALKRNALKREQFPGKDHLPPYSVIRDLDLPKMKCTIEVDASAPARPDLELENTWPGVN